MVQKNLSVLLALLAAACSSPPSLQQPSSDPGDNPKDAGSDAPSAPVSTLRFRPTTIYSGFDGEHTYKAPFAVYDADDDLSVTIDDSAVTIEKATLSTPDSLDTGRYYMLTMKKAGEFALTAKSKGGTATTKVVVSDYPTARWTAGQTRYTNGGSGNPPCTQCHSTTGIDHSPAALAGIDDRAVGLVITSGIAPNGFPIKVDDPSNHQWTVSDDEKNGLVTYLRSIEPRGFAQ